MIGNDWDPHCSLHLPELSSKRCGAVLYCHTLGRPAYCPFCLGNQQLVSSKRMQSWARDHQAVTHVALHLQDCHYPMACPHPLCETSLPDSTSIRFHFIDDHGMSAKLPKDVIPKNQLATLQDSFVVIDSPVTLKRRLPDRSRLERPSKRTRGTAAVNLPLCTTTTEAEHPYSAFSSKDEVILKTSGGRTRSAMTTTTYSLNSYNEVESLAADPASASLNIGHKAECGWE